MPHFMVALIPIYQFIKPFLDNKMSTFEEYGAFKLYICEQLRCSSACSDVQADLVLCRQYMPEGLHLYGRTQILLIMRAPVPTIDSTRMSVSVHKFPINQTYNAEKYEKVTFVCMWQKKKL